MSLEGLLTFWTEVREEEEKYMMIMLKGRFKGEVDESRNTLQALDGAHYV